MSGVFVAGVLAAGLSGCTANVNINSDKPTGGATEQPVAEDTATPTPTPSPEPATKADPKPAAAIDLLDCRVMNPELRDFYGGDATFIDIPSAGDVYERVLEAADVEAYGPVSQKALNAAGSRSGCLWGVMGHNSTQWNASVTPRIVSDLIQGVRDFGYTEGKVNGFQSFGYDEPTDGGTEYHRHVFVGDVWVFLDVNERAGQLGRERGFSSADADQFIRSAVTALQEANPSL